MKALSVVGMLLLVAVGAGVAISLPDITRYLKMRSM